MLVVSADFHFNGTNASFQRLTDLGYAFTDGLLTDDNADCLLFTNASAQ